jgi:hypothetical protein
VVVGHVNPANWLFDRWDLQALRCRTAIYDLAWKPFNDRDFQYIARSRDRGHPGSRGHFPLALLLLRFRLLHLLQSVFFALKTGFCAGGSSLLLFLDFLPSYLFTALSSFSWLCWIVPNNAKVNQLFGVSHGLAMGILTFDWGQIAFIGPPMGTPWWVAASVGFSTAFFYWFLAPILYVRRNYFRLSLFLFSEHRLL